MATNTKRNTPMEKKASDYNRSRLSGKYIPIEFEKVKRGFYKRFLTYMHLGGKNFNIELAEEGFTACYTKFEEITKHHEEFKNAKRYTQYRKENILGR